MKTNWKRKLAAYLHDPPSKALDIRTHGERSDAAFRQAGFVDTEIKSVEQGIEEEGSVQPVLSEDSLRALSGETIEWGTQWGSHGLEIYQHMAKALENGDVSSRFPCRIVALLEAYVTETTPLSAKSVERVPDFDVASVIERELNHVIDRQGTSKEAKADIVPKPLVITGWSLPDEAGATDAERDGGAKSTHLAVPVGTVYYFEADSPEDAAKLAATLNWHGKLGTGDSPATIIKNRRSTLLGENGFGLGVCRTWNFFA